MSTGVLVGRIRLCQAVWQLGYGRKDIEAAAARGMSHGVCEFEELRKAAAGGNGI